MDSTITVHRHYILRNVNGSRTGPTYRQVAVIEDSSPFHLQFFVKRWQEDELHNYFTRGKEIDEMTFAMHPTLSSALADVEVEIESARMTGEWEIQQAS
jgi:hypothetical protein